MSQEAQESQESQDISSLRQVCHELAELGRAEELLQWCDKALALYPHESGFTGLRALALSLLGRHAEAADTWARDPSCADDPASCRLRVGYNLMMAGDLARAIPLLDEARRIAAPDGIKYRIFVEAGHYLGEALLKAGDPRGFAYWLMRNEDPSSAASYYPAGIPVYTGGGQEPDLRGRRVLITHQLGFGDNFLLGACVRDWLDAGAKVMFTCDPQTHALMQSSLPGCEVVSASRPLQWRQPLPQNVLARMQAFAPHLYGTLLHLPLLKAARATSGYHFLPWIRASHAKQQVAAQWASWLRAQYPKKKLVGLFWDCYQRHAPEDEVSIILRWWAKRKSLPLDAVNRLVTDGAVANQVHFVNLHHPMVEAAAGTPAGNVSRYLPGIWDFDDTAACIGQLDAVIAVDSAVANLALMMGTTTCVPVNTSRDWRYGCHGTTSPWLTNVTVLQQTRESDWDPVVRNLAAWLLHWAAR